MELKSESVRNQLDYHYTMDEISVMRELNGKELLPASQRFGLHYANFYYEQINKMLENEFVDLDILRHLQTLVHTDLKTVRADAEERVANSISPEFTYQQTRKNNNMMSMIMDFIATLP